MLRSVNDINLPKFTVEDLPLFKGITSDLFPGVELGESDHGPLLQNIDTVCEEGITISPGQALKLIPVSTWRKKVIQLYEMVLVRHGVMIVGQTGSGKTTTVHTLAHAMSRCCDDGSTDFTRVQVLNSETKCVTRAFSSRAPILFLPSFLEECSMTITSTAQKILVVALYCSRV